MGMGGETFALERKQLPPPGADHQRAERHIGREVVGDHQVVFDVLSPIVGAHVARRVDRADHDRGRLASSGPVGAAAGSGGRGDKDGGGENGERRGQGPDPHLRLLSGCRANGRQRRFAGQAAGEGRAAPRIGFRAVRQRPAMRTWGRSPHGNVYVADSYDTGSKSSASGSGDWGQAGLSKKRRRRGAKGKDCRFARKPSHGRSRWSLPRFPHLDRYRSIRRYRGIHGNGSRGLGDICGAGPTHPLAVSGAARAVAMAPSTAVRQEPALDGCSIMSGGPDAE